MHAVERAYFNRIPNSSFFMSQTCFPGFQVIPEAGMNQGRDPVLRELVLSIQEAGSLRG